MDIVGVVSNIRYVERLEQQELISKQAPLGRSEATMAALIPREFDARGTSQYF